MAKLDWSRANDWRKTRYNPPQAKPKNIFNFGKYRGYYVHDVPIDYIKWCIRVMPNHHQCSVWIDEVLRRGKTTTKPITA